MTAPPIGPDPVKPAAAAPTVPHVRGRDGLIGEVVALLANQPSDQAAQRREHVRAAFLAAPVRDAGWPGAWVEERFGGLLISAPGHWRFQRGETQAAVWDLPSGALMTVMMLGFELRVPAAREQAQFMLSTDRHGHECVATAPIDHPRAEAPPRSAVAFVEHHPHHPAWPQRWYRLAPWTARTMLLCKLDIDGLPDAALLADVDAFWRRLG